MSTPGERSSSGTHTWGPGPSLGAQDPYLGPSVMRGLRRLSFPWSLCYWWLLPSPQCIDLRPMRRDSCAIIPSSSFPLLPKPFTFAPLLLLFIDSDLGLDHDTAFGLICLWTCAYIMMPYLSLSGYYMMETLPHWSVF